MKKLALLGSTGSIGTQALDVVRCIQKEGEHAVKVEALAAHSNIRLLEEQIREFKPESYYGITIEAGNVRWTWRDGKSGSLRTFKKERAQEIQTKAGKGSITVTKVSRNKICHKETKEIICTGTL